VQLDRPVKVQSKSRTRANSGTIKQDRSQYGSRAQTNVNAQNVGKTDIKDFLSAQKSKANRNVRGKAKLSDKKAAGAQRGQVKSQRKAFNGKEVSKNRASTYERDQKNFNAAKSSKSRVQKEKSSAKRKSTSSKVKKSRNTQKVSRHVGAKKIAKKSQKKSKLSEQKIGQKAIQRQGKVQQSKSNKNRKSAGRASFAPRRSVQSGQRSHTIKNQYQHSDSEQQVDFKSKVKNEKKKLNKNQNKKSHRARKSGSKSKDYGNIGRIQHDRTHKLGGGGGDDCSSCNKGGSVAMLSSKFSDGGPLSILSPSGAGPAGNLLKLLLTPMTGGSAVHRLSTTELSERENLLAKLLRLKVSEHEVLNV